MSYESEQDMQDGADGAGENADDLTMALAGGETSFVAEGKQPMSTGTMVVAGLLVACGAITYFMYIRNGPAEAAASPEQAQAEEIISKFNADPNKNQLGTMITNMQKVVDGFRREVPQVHLGSANPFQRAQPLPDSDQAAVIKQKELEKAKAAIKEAIGELKLQTIIHRDPKKAAVMINNAMYRKGQKITVAEGKITFTVSEIRSDAVTVSTPAGGETLTFELKMKR